MYNEHEYIAETISNAKKIMDLLFSDYEIIVVDNNSTDGSFERLAELSKLDEKIKLYRHHKVRDLGSVFRLGLSRATKEVIICSDFDLPYDLSVLKIFLPYLSEADIIQGYRIGNRESIMRNVYTKVYNFIIRAVFNLKLNDANFSMKIFKRKILEKVNLESKGPFIASELLIKAKSLGYKIKEVGVKHSPRKYGTSKICSKKDIFFSTFFIIREMLMLYPKIKALSRPKLIKKYLS
jgi:glycosyltransferase involved in cell wall biosynthesis